MKRKLWQHIVVRCDVDQLEFTLAHYEPDGFELCSANYINGGWALFLKREVNE
jgi:hypothetical protein